MNAPSTALRSDLRWQESRSDGNPAVNRYDRGYHDGYNGLVARDSDDDYRDGYCDGLHDWRTEPEWPDDPPF